MIKNKHLLVVLVSLFQVTAVRASAPGPVENGQVTSNMPQTLEILYNLLEDRMQQNHILATWLERLSHCDTNDINVINAHDKITQNIDVNSYRQQFLLHQIKAIEELHSSLAENKILNAIYLAQKKVLNSTYIVEERKLALFVNPIIKEQNNNSSEDEDMDESD